MTFVDTGGWAAFFVSEDADHRAAVAWMRENNDLLVTSDFVVDELLTLLKSRFSVASAVQAGEALWADSLSAVVFLSPSDIAEAWRIFRRYTDKDWSFTDCTSSAVMKRLGIRRVFSFDQDFSQMSGIHRVP